MDRKKLEQVLTIVGDMHDALAFKNAGDGRAKMRIAAGLVRELLAEAAEQPANPAQVVSDVLREALDFVNEASGAALGIAMSGSDHPNPDEVLTDLSLKGMDLAPRLTAAIGAGGQAVACKECDGTGFKDKNGARLTLARNPCGACGGSGYAPSVSNPADERVVEALRPFAKVCSLFDHMVDDGGSVLVNIRLGDLRAARAALSGSGDE